MANLSENTQYNSKGTQSSFPNLSSIMKGLQTKSVDSSSNMMKSSLSSQFNPELANSIFSPGKKVSTVDPVNEGVFPLGQPIGQQTEGMKTEAIPGYQKFKETDPYGKWVAPSDSATLRNWPTSLGGGQYVTDPTQPGKLIKSERVLWDTNLNPGGKKAVLGKRDSRFYQVDHIVPLWIGGADTAANSEILDVTTHERKTAVQSVPLTLLANGKIDLNQAKIMALTWKDKDTKGLPSADENGYVPLEIAEKYKEKWERDISNPSIWKYFGESFKENMANFGEGWLPDPIREFGKGLVGGGTAGIVPGTEASADSGTIGTIANMAGNILGTITGLGLLTKGVVKVLGGAKAVVGIKNGVTIADDAAKSAGLVTDIGKVSKAASKARIETLSKMARSAGLLGLWGQIGVTGREIVDKETEFEFRNHVKQFMTDVAFGSLLGASGQTMKGYSAVGLGSTSLSLMEGEDITTALQNGALMTALHGLGYKKGMIDPKIRVGNEEAYKMSATTFNQYVGPKFNTIKRGQPVPTTLVFEAPKIEQIKSEYKAAHPNDTRFDNVNDTGGAVQILGREARTNFLDTVKKSNGSISQDQISKEMKRITTAENQLYNQTLQPTARQNKEWKDLLSMGEKLRPQTKSSQFPAAKNHNEILNKIPETTTQQVPVETGKYPTGKSGITGYGGSLDAEAKFNVDHFASNPSSYDGKIYIPKTDKETASIMRLLQQEQIASGQSIGNPDKTLRAFVRTVDGEFKPIGYVPQEKSFDIKKDNLNKTYQIITTRLQEIRKSAKTPEAMMNYYNADKAGIKIDMRTAENLFSRRGENIPDEELYAILKPNNAYAKLDSKLNNEALSDQMEKLGLDYLVVDPYKAWEINGQRPRWNPENPYASIEITAENWAQSIAMNKTSKLTPVENAIKKVSEEIKVAEMEKTMKAVNGFSDIRKQSTSIQNKPLERPIEPTTRPVEASRTPVEAPFTPETSNISKPMETLKNASPKEKYKTIQGVVSKDPVYTATNEFFDDMVARIDSVKLKAYVSPEDFKKSMMNIIQSFKRKNPGLSEKDFKNAMGDAKGRASAYVQDQIDTTYKGTKYFGSDESYVRKASGPEKNVLEKRLDELNKIEKGRGTEDDPGLILRPPEKAEMSDLKVKIEKYSELQKQTEAIEKKAYNEKRSLKEEEKKTLRDLEQKRFTISEKYQRDPNLVLANRYGLKLTKPNDAGLQYIETDKRGNPIFSEEYLKLHDVKGKTPLEHWGSFLAGDWKVARSALTKNIEDWSKGIDSMKSSTKSYPKAWAETFDAIFTKKFGPKWKTSWKLNSTLKDFYKMNMSSRPEAFASKNPEGHGISEPNRAIAARTLGKNPLEIQSRVADANKITKAITSKAEASRLKDFSNKDEKSVLYQGDTQVYNRVKDQNQINNVIEDLTPFEIMMNGLITAPEARNRLLVEYNTLRREMGSGNIIPTRVDPITGETILGTAETMEKVFKQIRALSINIPDEIKKWKLGQKIVIKDTDPTPEQAIKDAYNVAMSMLKNKKTPGYVKFDNIKEEVLKKIGLPKKTDGKGGPYDGQGGLWSNVTSAITKPFSSTITYNREDYLKEEAAKNKNNTAPVEVAKESGLSGLFNKKQPTIPQTSTYNVRGLNISDNDINEATNILYGEISNRDTSKQAMEVKHAINTAINRANANPARYGGSIIKVLTEPAQYQSYAPKGIQKNGTVVESQYQKLKKGEIDEAGKKKLETIRQALSEMKSGSFTDTTGGKTFYVHANDGTMWLGATQKEAKELANAHEKSIKTKPTNWRTVAGFPHGASSGF